MSTGKTIALTRRTFVGKVMSLVFNMLSRLVITSHSILKSRDITLPTDQYWVFIGRTDVEAETPILWPPDVKSSLI